jgi:ABC-2 type transport system permease protein
MAADVLPLTQGIKLMKAASLGLPVNDAVIPLAVMAGLSVLCVCASIRFFKWE